MIADARDPFRMPFPGLFLSLAVAACPAFGADPEPAPPVQEGKGHHFACTDYTQGKVFIVSPAGETEWEYPARHCNDLWVLPNGNTVMSNWLGHGNLGKAPHLIEVTPDKKVVWTFFDHKTMKTISSIYLLDVPGEAAH